MYKSSNTVLKKHFYFILCLLFLITGCTVHWTIPVVNVKSIHPAVTEKISLDVGISIPDEAETVSIYIQPDPGGLIDIFPVGQLIKKASQNIFSHSFKTTTLIKGRYYPHGSNALLVIKVKEFKALMPHYGKIIVSMSVNFVLLDMKRMPVWETVVNLSKTKSGPIFFGNTLELHGLAAAELVNEIFKKAAEEMVRSREIHAYAAGKGQLGTMVSSRSPEPSAAVKFDVDEIPQVQAKPKKNAYAIVIGVEKYRQNLPKADFADHDARIMAEYLTKAMGYPEENIVTLINDRALKSDLEKYLGKWLPNNVEKDSSVFIYYSGHGAPNPKTGDAFLVPYDGDPSFIEETGYPLKRLYAKLDRLQAKEIIVVLDSCFSGAGGRSVLAKGARPLVMNMDKQVLHSDRIAILSASSGGQISSTHEEKGHGLFTYFLLKGIKEGNSELGTLYNYLKPQVERIARKTYNNEQTPGLIAPKGLLNLRLYDR